MAKIKDRAGERLRLVASGGKISRPLRVMCLNYEYPPMGGGAGNATKQTVIELSRRGHRVDVVTSRLPAQADVASDANLVIYRVFSRRRSIHQAGLMGAISYVFSALFKLRRLSRVHDYDIFHFYFGLPTGILALYVHWALKKPYIVSLRGSDVPGYDNTRLYLRPLHALLRPLSNFIWSRARFVTAISHNLKALAHNTSPHVDIEVINNAVHPEVFRRERRTLRAGAVRLICVCRLVRRKGLEYLIRAMQELKKSGVRLEIVGAGEREAQVRSFIKACNVDSHISLAGYVPQEGLSEHYGRADIFVLPSLSESFGQVLLEAMSSGLPVIASSVGGIPEIVDHEAGGLLIEPASSGAIVSAVTKLANDPKRRHAMGAYNVQQVTTRFRWSTVAENYEDLYYKALRSGPRSVKSGA